MKFQTGTIVFTRGVYSLMEESKEFSEFVFSSLGKHQNGDWGNCCSGDKKLNDEALIKGSRLFSTYLEEKKIYIITEWDRSVNTILFPEEY